LTELKKTARERAFSDYQNMMDASGEVPWQDELLDSLKELYAAANVKMRDWQLGAYSYSYVKAEFPRDGAADLRGSRALAWIENNLLAQFRAPFGLNTSDGNLHSSTETRGRKSRKVWRRWYTPGAVKECPLTGYCADMDYIEDLIKSVKEGRTLKEAFEDLAAVYVKLLEGEIEYQRSEEAFKDWASANDTEFQHNGERI